MLASVTAVTCILITLWLHPPTRKDSIWLRGLPLLPWILYFFIAFAVYDPFPPYWNEIYIL